MPSPKIQRKFVVMGFRAVGKSTITVRFVENQFTDTYNPTIENTYLKPIKHRGREYDCEIIDTSGQDEFSIFQSQYAIGIHGYILVYSVNNAQSFELVQIINDKILNAIGATHVPRLLVGNKCDLKDRVIPTAQGRALAQEWDCRFVECSAKMNQNIDDIFVGMLDEVDRDSAPMEPKKKDSGCILQ
mmetsp:Transcript_15653/g.26909  ORF Transcript_15653/g.26909 Transcript_15653/m.26909 type:complete len:187 (+) Transcript_15653:58-618(+)